MPTSSEPKGAAPASWGSAPFDHLVYGVPDLDVAVGELAEQLGVRAGGGGQHQGLGTRNALIGLGSSAYIEIIAPDPDQATPAFPRPFGLDELTEPRMLGWALRCEGIDARVATSRVRGYDTGEAIEISRTTAAGGLLVWRLTLNAVGGGPIPFLIDWGTADHPSRSAPRGLTLVSFHIELPQPGAIAIALAALETDVRVIAAPDLSLVALLDGPRGQVELR